MPYIKPEFAQFYKRDRIIRNYIPIVVFRQLYSFVDTEIRGIFHTRKGKNLLSESTRLILTMRGKNNLRLVPILNCIPLV
jgi:hypothetical protein